MRTYRSRLPAEKHGLSELHVLSDEDGNVLRAEAMENLALAQHAVRRPHTCLRARRVSHVTTNDGLQDFVAALGFQLSHESLRRGHAFRQDAAFISLFELCGRQTVEISDAGAGSGDTRAPMKLDDAAVDYNEACWKPLSGDVWLVEIAVRGDQMKSLIESTDSWADTLSTLPSFVLQPTSTAGSTRKSA